MRIVNEHPQRESAFNGSETVAVGSGAEHDVEESFGSTVVAEHVIQLTDVATENPTVDIFHFAGEHELPGCSDEVAQVRVRILSGKDARQAKQDLPLVWLITITRQHRRRVVGNVVHRKVIEREVVVALFESARWRQDDGGMAAGFGYVRINSHHEFERGERLVEPAGIRVGRHRISTDHDQGAHLTYARRFDFLRQRADGKLAQGFRRLADTGRGASHGEAAALTRLSLGGRLTDGAHRKHGAADAVEIASEQVHHIDQP